MLSVSARVVATLIVRLCSPALTPVAKAAQRHEDALRRVFLRGVRRAQEAVSMGELEDVLALGHPGTGAPLYVLQPAFDALLEQTERRIVHEPYVRAAAEEKKVAGVLGDAMQAGAEAVETCVIEKFVYHGTPGENLESIKKYGLRPNEYGNPLNFHHIQESSQYYAGEEGALFRVRVSDIPSAKSDLTQRTWTLSTIPPEKIEIYIDGKWKPLLRAKK